MLISNRSITKPIPKIGDGPPTEFLLLPVGSSTTPDGLELTVDDESLTSVIAAFKDHGVDIIIDWEHASELEGADIPPQGAPAAGWCNLEARSDGIWATSIRWIAPADQYLTTGAYRYFSPTMYHTKEGRVVGIKSIALTGQPRIDNLQPLLAARIKDPAMNLEDMAKAFSDQADKHHAQNMEQMKALVDMHKASMEHLSKLAESKNNRSAKDADESEDDSDDDDEDEMKASKAKAQGLIEGSIGVKLTPGEGRDLIAKLEAKTIPPEYVETYIAAKASIEKPRAEGVSVPVSFGFSDAEVARCKTLSNASKYKIIESKLSTAAEADAMCVAACKALGYDDAKIAQIAKAWRENVERYNAAEKSTYGIRLSDKVKVNQL